MPTIDASAARLIDASELHDGQTLIDKFRGTRTATRNGRSDWKHFHDMFQVKDICRFYLSEGDKERNRYGLRCIK